MSKPIAAEKKKCKDAMKWHIMKGFVLQSWIEYLEIRENKNELGENWEEFVKVQKIMAEACTIADKLKDQVSLIEARLVDIERVIDEHMDDQKVVEKRLPSLTQLSPQTRVLDQLAELTTLVQEKSRKENQMFDKIEERLDLYDKRLDLLANESHAGRKRSK